MVDAEDHDFSLGFVDAVQHSVRAAPGRADARQVAAQLLAHSLRILEECARDELDDGCGDRSGQPGLDRPNGWWR